MTARRGWIGARVGGAWLAMALSVAAARSQPADGGFDALSAALNAARADEQRRVAMLARVTPGVVCIFGDRERGGGGTGAIIDPAGYGLTNFHVVADFVESRHGYGGLSDGRLYRLRVLGIDPGGDIAMFKLEGRERFEPIDLGDSDALRLGQWVAALGNPFLLAEDLQPTVTIGVISGLNRYQEGEGNLLEYADCIQVSTSINPGNSGGPLVDMQGRLIGINGRASFEERGRVNVGLGYAVTLTQIRRFLPSLRAGRLCEHGTLGAVVQQAGADVIFQAVQDLSPAERAGIAPGDQLLSIEGRPVQTPNEFNNIIATLPANWPTRVRFRHDQEEREAVVRLERLPARLPFLYLPDMEHNRAEVANQLRRFARRCGWEAPAPTDGVRFAVRVERDSEAPQTAEWIVPASAASPGASLPAEAPAKLADEWQRIVAPLIGPPRIDADWEMLGGDAVDGRIVTVIERRGAAGGGLRWKFALADDALLQIALGERAEAERVVWSAGDESADGPRWPRTWQRRVDGELTATIRIERVAAVLQEQPASEAPGAQP